MKKKLPLLIIGMCAVAAVSITAATLASRNNVSALLMSNIEALASGEGSSGSCVVTTGTCTHEVNGNNITEPGMALE